MKKKSLFFVLLLIIGCSTTQQIVKSPFITPDELKHHVRYLASDELEGRKAGTKGNNLAAEYIANEFAKYGLKPFGVNKTFFQNFTFISDLKIGKNNSLTIKIKERIYTYEPGIDFTPMNFSEDTSITANLVFVGYGISSDSLEYDDYAGVDVKNKVVIMMRYSPDGDSSGSPFFEYSTFQKKIITARDKGVAGIIFINGPQNENKNQLIPLRLERGSMNSGIAVINLKCSIAEDIFNSYDKNLDSIQRFINKNKKPASFEFTDVQVKLQTHIERIYSETKNVVGILEGNHPTLKEQYIIIGAHFDHIGLGGPGSGSLLSDTIAIHNGADDNASGTAGLLEIAQYISARRQEINRSFIFVAFSAEELGLLGSAYFVKNPPIDLKNSVAMLNMDMIGRLRDSVLTVQGVGTSPVWNEIIARQNSDSIFKLKLGQDGFGSSDHASFNAKEIPVLFFFTGLHSDYHKPTDDWNLINYEGQKLVADFVTKIALDLDTISIKPEYTKVAISSSQREGMRGFRVSFGIMPDFGDDAKGLRISGTRAGSAAEKAGLKANDIIIKFGGKSVKNIYDLTSLLGDYKPGDEVEVVVLRGEETLTFKAVLQGR